MILHITIGTNDISRAQAFYDPVMAAVGFRPDVVRDHELSYVDAASGPGETASGPSLWVMTPYDGKPASTGNGTSISFAASSRAVVNAFHAAALAHGGTDDGPPGLRRYGPHYYAASVRDPDGNKLAAVCNRPE